MSVSFDSIQLSQILPFIQFEFAGTAPASAGALVYPSLLLGQMLSTGTAIAATKVRVTSAADAAGLFGRGSQLHGMCAAFFAQNPLGQLYAIPLADDGAGTAAHTTITVVTTTPVAGTLFLRVAGRLVQVAVSEGDDPGDIASNIASAINADLDLPVTASATAEVVTVTCRHKGTLGNQISISLNAAGQAGGEVTPSGVAITLGAELLGGGATDPTSASWVTAMADDGYDCIALPLTTSGLLGVTKTEMARRWGPTPGVQGHAFAAALDTSSNLVALGTGRNDPHLSIAGLRASASWLTPAYEAAAAFAGAASLALANDPGAPLTGIRLAGVHAGTQFDPTSREALAAGGITTLTVDGGDVYLESEVTTYTKNPTSSVADQTWQFVQVPFILQRWRRRVQARIRARYPRHKLGNDGDTIRGGQRIVTAGIVKAEIVAEYKDMVRDALAEDVATFKASLLVARNDTNPNRLDVLARPNLINAFRQLAVRSEFSV